VAAAVSNPGTPIRWREDTGWEYRCPECAKANRQCFWPLGPEFWDRPRGMARCRACWKARDARASRARYAALPELKKERRREQARSYRRAARHAQAIKDRAEWQAILRDPALHEAAKAAGRVHQAAYRQRQRAAA
jgi:hypothetical protein